MPENKNPANRPIKEAWLKEVFMRLNSRFFDNRIPGSIQVLFMKNCGHVDLSTKKKKWISASAYFYPLKDVIFVDEGLKYFPDFIIIAILHEMAHVDLKFRGYVGWPADKGHGTKFHGEIIRLINAGAYDDLL